MAFMASIVLEYFAKIEQKTFSKMKVHVILLHLCSCAYELFQKVFFCCRFYMNLNDTKTFFPLGHWLCESIYCHTGMFLDDTKLPRLL